MRLTKRDVLDSIYAIISAPNNAMSPLDWHNEETRRYQECKQIALDAGYADSTFYQLWDMAINRYAVVTGCGIR